ncbi:MAG: hypothetical protein ACR2FY_15095 [Pirellulaceae bacterium]
MSQPDSNEPYGGIDIIFHDDGTVTEERFGQQRPQELTEEELLPFIAWAQHRLERDRQEAEAAKAACYKATRGHGYVPH